MDEQALVSYPDDCIAGTYPRTLDPKNRMIIPPALREELGDTFYLIMGADECLAMYPLGSWKKFTDKFASLPTSKSKAMRALFANAVKCVPDSQGRVMIPQRLKDYAGLDKDVVIIGVKDRAEIWSADLWNQSDTDMTPAKMGSLMEELGL